ARWDEARVGEVGAVLAAEARRKGVDVVLAPTLNLHRSPLGGLCHACGPCLSLIRRPGRTLRAG
ncbi:hypothetical protein CLM83_25590, partial [Streptomyces albidoflavus]